MTSRGSASTPTHSDNDITTSTVPSYAASRSADGQHHRSVVVTPSDTQDTKKRPSANNGAVAFEDLAFEFAAEEESNKKKTILLSSNVPD